MLLSLRDKEKGASMYQMLFRKDRLESYKLDKAEAIYKRITRDEAFQAEEWNNGPPRHMTN